MTYLNNEQIEEIKKAMYDESLEEPDTEVEIPMAPWDDFRETKGRSFFRELASGIRKSFDS